jgi:hypothetical protein
MGLALYEWRGDDEAGKTQCYYYEAKSVRFVETLDRIRAPLQARTSKPLPNDARILSIENAADAIAERAMT